jgi:hypothetical protein
MQDKDMYNILKGFDAATNNQINESKVAECGMQEMDTGMDRGVTLKTSSASEMAEILRALAGVDSKPEMPAMDEPMDMPVKMELPMGEPEEDIEEWDNSPEEEYQDTDAVVHDGDDLLKTKKGYAATQLGDNPMAVESVKDRLWAALNEKKKQKDWNNDGKNDWEDVKAARMAAAAKAAKKKKTNEVAGPDKCWPGYAPGAKTGVKTKAGTGKNKGKRVNNCEPTGK